MTSANLQEIQTRLRAKSSKAAKESVYKFSPTLKGKVYGVRFPELNKLATEFKKDGFVLAEELWNSSAFEEQVLAAKLLWKVSQTDPDKAMQLLKRFSKNITEWCICDTLATQGMRNISKEKQREIFTLSRKLVKSKNLWERRLGLVLLVNFAKDKALTKQIETIVKTVEDDPEYYVQKAVAWVRREL